MIKLIPLQLQKIKEAALLRYPLEMCGVCTLDDFIELNNVHETPEKSFAFNHLEYAKVVDKTIAIVHSHTKSIHDVEIYDLRTPSHKDMIGQKRSGKPWLIVGCEGVEVSDPVCIPRIPSDDLLNRPFIWYINDCYTIVVDYYKFYMGIDIKLHDDSFDWLDINVLNGVFDEYIEKYGFRWLNPSEERQNGDILIMSTRDLNANHLGIFHNGNVIHQDGISVEQPLSMFHRRINGTIRYVG